MYAAFASRVLDPPFLGDDVAAVECLDPEKPKEHLHEVIDRKNIATTHVATFPHGAMVASEGATYLESGSLFIAVTGAISNIPEMCELYSISPIPRSSVELLEALYEKEFSDTYGDGSDQPATAISTCQGSWAFMLYDVSCGYFLAARSPCGVQPLHWGTSKQHEDIAMISTAGDGLAQFPPGCQFESNGEGTGELANFTRHTPTSRRINTMPKVDSHGHLCAVMYTTQSGSNLVAMGGVGQPC